MTGRAQAKCPRVSGGTGYAPFMVGTVKVCRDVRSARVGLGASPKADGRVVAVEMGSFEGDAEADRFRLLLARALVAEARVTFLDDALEPPLPRTWEARGEDFVAELPLGSAQAWTRRLTGLLGFDETRGMVSTRRAKRAARLFDGTYFAWWAQAQIGLLSTPGSPPPPLDAHVLDALLSDGWVDAIAALGRSGVVGGLRPGVDGGVAGLFFLDPACADAFLADLAAAAKADDLAFAEVPSEAFP